MKTFKGLVVEYEKFINEIMPWDLEQKLASGNKPLLLDIREAEEFNAMHIKGSINIARGILESACDYDYYETNPELVQARDKEIVVVCRSGNRSVLAAYTMQQMGYKQAISLKTGLKGWNDDEQPLVDNNDNEINIEIAESFLNPKINPAQLKP